MISCENTTLSQFLAAHFHRVTVMDYFMRIKLCMTVLDYFKENISALKCVSHLVMPDSL